MKEIFELNHKLVDPITTDAKKKTTFAACLNAHGQYTTEHFVLRLSPRVHALINSIQPGLYTTSAVSEEVIQAYSTYLHETVHWWQHMGSTAGLVFSLGYPAQSHVNLEHLRAWLKIAGPQKSIKTWAKNAMLRGRTHDDNTVREANIIVNNAMDIGFYKLLSYDPMSAKDLVQDPYFECVGHSYCIAYGQLIAMLTATFDREFQHFPDARIWDEEFPKLTAERHLGFYHGSKIMLAPVGLQALFEGQARFCQLQYLAFGASQSLTCEYLRTHGYLSGIYITAFEVFLKITKSDWPARIDDPLVGLFLLLCDLALNPSRGFPLQIANYRNFITDVDPGIRFVQLCKVIGNEHPDLRKTITEYSREEYIRVSEILTNSCGYDHPMRTLEEVVRWPQTVPEIKAVMTEQDTFNFEIKNLPIRVLFSHFLKFSSDKLKHPEFFCWPGAWMAGSRTSEAIQTLFLTHLSLFSDKEDDDGVFPRIFPGKDPKNIKKTFDVFFGNNILYDLVQQWILNDGPFDYDLSWLSQAYTNEEMANAAKDSFKHLFGVSPDDFIVF
jgi:hypothetical protein